MWATVPAHRTQESLSLPTFKRKQLRHEPYPNRPPPPLGTSFLPLSRTDTLSVFLVQSQDTFIQHCVQPTLTPTTPAVPFPFLSVSFPFPYIRLLFRWPGIAHWSHIQPLMCVQAYIQTCPCYHDVLELYISVSSFYPDFSHLCSVKLFLIQLLNHLKSSELTAQASTNRFFDRIRAEILLKCYLNMIFYVQSSLVQSISANMISQIFPGYCLLVIKSLLALLCLAFGEICLQNLQWTARTVQNEPQRLKRGRKRSWNSFRLLFLSFSSLYQE